MNIEFSELQEARYRALRLALEPTRVPFRLKLQVDSAESVRVDSVACRMDWHQKKPDAHAQKEA